MVQELVVEDAGDNLGRAWNEAAAKGLLWTARITGGNEQTKATGKSRRAEEGRSERERREERGAGERGAGSVHQALMQQSGRSRGGTLIRRRF